MPLNPHDWDAKLTGVHEAGWWGIAEQVDPTSFRVTRYADYDRACALSDDQEAIRVWIVGSSLDQDLPQPHIAAPGTPGGRWCSSSAMVSSAGLGGPWVFAATGWELPEVIR
jgi:hypothetical protein